MAILRSVKLPYETAAALCERWGLGHKLDPRTVQVDIQGARMLVFVIPADEFYNRTTQLIRIPKGSAERREGHGAGIVLNVGPRAGHGPDRVNVVHPFGVECDEPSDLLGQRVTMGQWVGKPMRFDLMHGEWESPYWTITDRDVQSVVPLDIDERPGAPKPEAVPAPEPEPVSRDDDRVRERITFKERGVRG